MATKSKKPAPWLQKHSAPAGHQQPAGRLGAGTTKDKAPALPKVSATRKSPQVPAKRSGKK